MAEGDRIAIHEVTPPPYFDTARASPLLLDISVLHRRHYSTLMSRSSGEARAVSK